MRPQGSVGEVRAAIRDAVRTHGPMALRDMPQRACIGQESARNTLKNMVRSGELERVGHERRPHCKKFVALYDLAMPVEQARDEAHDGGLMVLSAAIGSWR